MLRDPGDIVPRASGEEHGCGETPAHCERLEEDRRFGAEELRGVPFNLKLTRCPHSLAVTLAALASMSLIPFTPFLILTSYLVLFLDYASCLALYCFVAEMPATGSSFDGSNPRTRSIYYG